jgi:hypothetical protein
MTREIPAIDLPQDWREALTSWDLPSEAAVLAAFLDDCHPVHQLAAPESGPAAARFAGDLLTALAAPGRSAAVCYPADAPVTTAALLVGRALGEIRETCDPPLVGPVEVDVASTALRSSSEQQIRLADGQPIRIDNSPWHTDASPWRVPARWTVLGMSFCDPRYADAPTDIAPAWYVTETWRGDRAHLTVLRETDVDWRQAFGGIGSMMAPVLGPSVTRWLAYLLMAELADDGAAGRACRAFDEHLTGLAPLYRPVVRPGLLLITDNHQVIHRGPAIDQPRLRRISKIKVGGVPER